LTQRRRAGLGARLEKASAGEAACGVTAGAAMGAGLIGGAGAAGAGMIGAEAAAGWVPGGRKPRPPEASMMRWRMSCCAARGSEGSTPPPGKVEGKAGGVSRLPPICPQAGGGSIRESSRKARLGKAFSRYFSSIPMSDPVMARWPQRCASDDGAATLRRTQTVDTI
jgi:hypothetical protein